MKLLHRIWDIITTPFIALAVWVDDSKRINEDGSWDEYNKKRNTNNRRNLK